MEPTTLLFSYRYLMNVHVRKYNSSSVVGGPFPVIYSHLGSLQRGHSCRVQQQMHKMKRTKPKELI